MTRRWSGACPPVSPAAAGSSRRFQLGANIPPPPGMSRVARQPLLQVDAPTRSLVATVILLILVAGTCYNALLGIVNAHVAGIGTAVVAATEALILAAGFITILTSGRRPIDLPGFLILALFLVDALYVSLASGVPTIAMARNGAIIALFLMLGARIDETTLKRCFLLCAVLVFAVLLLDAFAVKSYAQLFAPSLYFERTRGVTPFELDELGLFRNALGFSERFSISNLSDHRTSSLFLEQVSLANFSTILVIYLTAMWQRLPRWPRLFYIVLIVFILLSNNSRTGLSLALIAPAIYWIAPRLNRFTPLLVMPIILIIAAIVAMSLPLRYDDTMSGRIGLTMRALESADLPAMLGQSAPLAIQFSDSGYAFLIYSMSLAGLVLMWLIMSLILALPGAVQRRCALLMSLYMFGNLLIGGNAVFTIKIAALQWLLVGFLRREGLEPPAVLDVALAPARQSPRFASARPL